MTAQVIRLATADDLPAIVAIYNHEVVSGVATFDTEPWELATRATWLASHDPVRHPVTVLAEAGRVLGWASLSEWSTRCAYARAAEISVYVHHEHRGRGLGRALLADLIARGGAAGLGVLLARIEASGAASLRLHRSVGFHDIGIMRRVGEKFGRILDVALLELHLDGEGRGGVR
jgi:phosphinothricin acetyltransferase